MTGALSCRLALALVAAATALYAATLVPDSSILPATLNTTLSSKHGEPGEAITARIMQDVPLPGDARIPVGAALSGEVTAVERASASGGGSISFRFDTLRTPHENIRLKVQLRALASFVEIRRAQLPDDGDSTAPENAWTTVQIGGDVVYRGGGSVRSRSGVVGRYVKGGVLGRLDSNPGRGCPQDGTGERAQALWLFSSDACGVYGLHDVTIARAEGNAAVAPAEITLRATQGDVNVHEGSGLLLRVVAPASPGA